MIKKLLQTDGNVSALLARIALGFVILPHGLQKLLGMCGGSGFTETIGSLTNPEGIGLSAVVAFLVIIGESFGALGLIVGFISRLCALGITLIMIGAVNMVHLEHGFFMNWYGNAAGEGYEYHILAIGLGLIVLIKGGGRWSIDRSLS